MRVVCELPFRARQPDPEFDKRFDSLSQPVFLGFLRIQGGDIELPDLIVKFGEGFLYPFSDNLPFTDQSSRGLPDE